MSIILDRKHLEGFISDKELDALIPNIEKAHNDLEKRTGAGREYTGWTDLPGRIDPKILDDLIKLGKEVRSYSDCIISIGIGGSYLGIRATVEYMRGGEIPIYYAGHNINADYLHKLLASLKDQRITVVVISKSGMTTEPAIAFRIIKKMLMEKYEGEELRKRIICVTDKSKGALRQIADAEGYKSFVIPDDIGGRFSVLTPVGLVPLALVGIDIKGLVEGAVEGQKVYSKMDLETNISYQYAAARYLLHKKGKDIEVTASFYDNMKYVIEWWKQLYGESEAKDGKGIFPASLILSTDLHSMGQLMQDGMRNVFETFIDIQSQKYSVIIPEDDKNLDDFNLVAGKDLDFVNKQAYKATAEAHFEGGVPNMTISLSQADPFHLGQLYYFYERTVAIAGYLEKVNPFNQPGVEAYKKKMFALLGRK
ncbi:MAG: glucose-6-phosphate isomerase [Omnitrophica WOR_2 bacterium RIFOXYC2_FULL_38_12]|nr:MAG: glucose-6-phosphate isomerase [Omnitrophica WOR_2 bacterium RIFOXYC2_FULL_38_12]